MTKFDHNPYNATSINLQDATVIRQRLSMLTGAQITMIIDALKGDVQNALNEDAASTVRHQQELINYLAA